MGLTSCRLTTLTVGKRINITHLKQDKVKHYHARHGIKTKGKTKMKKLNIYLLSMMMIVTSFSLVSCDDDDDCYADYLPTALVTVYPQGDDAFTMQLDDKTTLVPTNMKSSPFGEKEVRALVNYVEETGSNGSYRNVRVNWIDSIRTKYPVMTTDDDNLTYGNDPIEIVRDWLTVAEDGFLTLRIRTLWGLGQGPHIVNLVYGTEEGNVETLVLHHDAQGDTNGVMTDGLIAFNLNKLYEGKENVTLKLKWNSFSGPKSLDIPLSMHKKGVTGEATNLKMNSRIK